MLFTDEVTGIFTFQFFKEGGNDQSTPRPLSLRGCPPPVQPVSLTPAPFWISSSNGAHVWRARSSHDWLPASPLQTSPRFRYSLRPSPALRYYQPPCPQSLPASIHAAHPVARLTFQTGGPFPPVRHPVLLHRAHTAHPSIQWLLKPRPNRPSRPYRLFSNYSGLGSVKSVSCPPTCPGLSVLAHAVPTMKNGCHPPSSCHCSRPSCTLAFI